MLTAHPPASGHLEVEPRELRQAGPRYVVPVGKVAKGSRYGVLGVKDRAELEKLRVTGRRWGSDD